MPVLTDAPDFDRPQALMRLIEDGRWRLSKR
jgi:hypothetical protein